MTRYAPLSCAADGIALEILEGGYRLGVIQGNGKDRYEEQVYLWHYEEDRRRDDYDYGYDGYEFTETQLEFLIDALGLKLRLYNGDDAPEPVLDDAPERVSR